MSGERFTGASDHPLLQDWLAYCKAEEFVWATEFRTLAERAESLACNDSFIAALVAAHILGTLGPTGLRSTSLYDIAREEAATPEGVRALRRRITAITDGSWLGRDLDAENVRSRLDLEIALAWSAFVKGEGFAVRVWIDGRSRWRLVDPVRVKNPKEASNSATLRDGFVLSADGRVTGLWVVRGKIGRWGMPEDDAPIFVPWTAADGTPNVIHRVGYRLPGMLRGVSRLAPMIVMSRQLAGVLEAHVAAKRLQAIYGMIVETEDPDAYKDAVANGMSNALGSPAMEVSGPLNVWLKPPGSTVQFTDTKFNGADLKDYLTIVYKVQCAAVQVPVDVVLCQMGEASLSSARAGLDQFDRTCQAEQERHISECTAVIDQVEIAGAQLRGEISIDGDPVHTLAAKYTRPPKYSTDRKKDADTITGLLAAGVSKTTAYAMFGLVYEDERELVQAEREFEAAQGGAPSGSGQPTTPSTDESSAPAPAPEDQAAATSWWNRTLALFRSARRNAA